MQINYRITDNFNDGIEIIGNDLRVVNDLAPGSYTLELTITNASGWSKTISEQIDVPAGDPNRYMAFATRTRNPSGTPVSIGAASSTYKCSKIVFSTPSYPTNDLRFHFEGFASVESGSSPQETVLPNAPMIIDKVILKVGTALHELEFGGASGTSIASGSIGAWTDRIVLSQSLLPESDIELWTFYHGEIGNTQVPVYRVQKHRGERIWAASNLAELETYLSDPLAPSTPNMDLNYGSSTQPQYYGPGFMVAKGWDGRPVALAVVDSIGDERNEFAVSADQRGNLGWLRRWLDNPDGIGRIPHMTIGCAGSGSARELNTNALKRWAVIDEVRSFNDGKLPFTVMLNELQTNDYDANYSTFRSRYAGFLDRFTAAYPQVKKVGVTALPRTTSSNAWRTRASQTYVSGAEPSGVRFQLMDEIVALMGNKLDAAIDVRSTYWDLSYPATWPEPYFFTTLAAQAGTDGSTPYNTLTLTQAPQPGDFLRWGVNGAQLGSVVSVSGTGPFTVTLDRNTNTAVSLIGSEVFAANVADQVHPYARFTRHIAATLDQSEKLKLIG